MQCGICDRHKQRLYCVGCTRAALWPLRSGYVIRTNERDAQAERIEEYLENPPTTKKARKEELQERIQRIREESARLRNGMEADRVRLATARAHAEAKRRRLEAVQYLPQKQEQIQTAIQKDIRRTTQKWTALYGRTAEARSYLCREAAALYGLRLKRRRSGVVHILIGGVQLPHLLQDLNTIAFTNVNTSLGHLAHLAVLVSHYIGLKLPHEIILPERNNPFTSIRGVLHNRHLANRPLSVDTPLATLSRENNAQHTKFVEGISMLAMNIAWLCFSQGLEINDVDEACNIGFNMWKLLVAKDNTAVTNPNFGKASHMTVYGNLATARGEEMMSRFKLGYKSIVEKIRYTLQGETIVADWDMISYSDPEPPPATGDAAAESSDAGSAPGRASAGGTGFDRWTRLKFRSVR